MQLQELLGLTPNDERKDVVESLSIQTDVMRARSITRQLKAARAEQQAAQLAAQITAEREKAAQQLTAEREKAANALAEAAVLKVCACM